MPITSLSLKVCLPLAFTALLTGGAVALDGSNSAPAALSPGDAFRTGARAYYAGDKDTAVSALMSAAEQGHAMAQWKLGRMYAQGDGVAQDHMTAFRYFGELADTHADEPPATPAARFVANAFVQLGTYFRDGIPGTEVHVDARRAADLFIHAATYFGDPEAQYSLARLYLDGVGVSEDSVQAARWLTLAAQKDHAQAQAVLGEMLFRGNGVPRRAVEGLMWLELARQGAQPDASDAWIGLLHQQAFAEADPADSARALERAGNHQIAGR